MAFSIVELDDKIRDLSEHGGKEQEGPWAFLALAGGKLIRYSVRGQWAVAEGDIRLGRIEDAESIQLPSSTRVAIFGARLEDEKLVPTRSGLWKGSIPYACDSEWLAEKIKKAAVEWGARLNGILPLGPRTTAATAFLEFKQVASQVGCWSEVGRAERQPQEVWLASTGRRTILHEVCHAAGLFHEHNRPDRNTYIEVIPGAITNGRGREVIPPRPDFGEALPPYDFDSITHYRPKEFGPQKFFRVTFEGLQHYKDVTGGSEAPSFVGQTLSDGDVQAIRTLYGM